MPVTKTEIDEAFQRFSKEIKMLASRGDIKHHDLVGDVINETYEIAIEKKHRMNAINGFRQFIRRWIKDGIKKVLKNHKCEIKIIQDKNIPQFYEKVQELVKIGYHEDEAKEIVRITESILRHRIIFPAEIDDTQNAPLLTNPQSHSPEKLLIEKEKQEIYHKAELICLEKYKNKKNKDAQILIERHYKETPNNQLSERYDLSAPSISSIYKKGLEFLKKCIECQLKTLTLEEAI